VHGVHHSYIDPAQNGLKWCIWCTKNSNHRTVLGQNGALRAPFATISALERVKMVHVVHRFRLPQWKHPSKWCIWCTILVVILRKNAQNGSLDAPFCGGRALFSRKMVHVVYHLHLQ